MTKRRFEKVADNTIRNIIKKLKREKDVKALYLFGSYARKKVKPYSDIDICVITGKNLGLESKAGLISGYLSEKIDMPIFWDLPLSIRFRVFKEGKLLLCKDKLFLHRIKVDTVKRYLDFKPLLKKYFERTFR